MGCLFHFLNGVFLTRNIFFNFDEVQSIYFVVAVVACIFGVISENHLPNPRS